MKSSRRRLSCSLRNYCHLTEIILTIKVRINMKETTTSLVFRHTCMLLIGSFMMCLSRVIICNCTLCQRSSNLPSPPMSRAVNRPIHWSNLRLYNNKTCIEGISTSSTGRRSRCLLIRMCRKVRRIWMLVQIKCQRVSPFILLMQISFREMLLAVT